MAPFSGVAVAVGGLRKHLPTFPDTHPSLMVRLQPQIQLDSERGGLGVAKLGKKYLPHPSCSAELVSRILQERRPTVSPVVHWTRSTQKILLKMKFDYPGRSSISNSRRNLVLLVLMPRAKMYTIARLVRGQTHGICYVRIGKKVLTNAPPPVYRAGGGLKKGSSPTGSGWEFFVSKMVFNKTER